MGASLFPDAVTRKLLRYQQSRQRTDSHNERIPQSLRDVSAVLAELSLELGVRYVLAVCLVSGEHCFVYHKMRNQMCFTSFSKTATRTWPCPCVCGWRETTHDANRVSENGPTNKTPLSNGSHQCIWDLKITNAPLSKWRNMDPKLQWWLDCVCYCC